MSEKRKIVLVFTVGDLAPSSWTNYTDFGYIAEKILDDFEETPNDPEQLKLEAPGGMAQRVLTMGNDTTKLELMAELHNFMSKAWPTSKEI